MGLIESFHTECISINASVKYKNEVLKLIAALAVKSEALKGIIRKLYLRHFKAGKN